MSPADWAESQNLPAKTVGSQSIATSTSYVRFDPTTSIAYLRYEVNAILRYSRSVSSRTRERT